MMEAIKTLLPWKKRHAIMQKTRYRTIEIDPSIDGLSEKLESDSFFESSNSEGGGDVFNRA